MTIRRVLRAGHPMVRQRSRQLDSDVAGNESVQQLIDDMLETMRDRDGVGLAAPQVQSGVRVLVYEITPNERYPDLEESVPATVMVNPELTARSSGLNMDWEGCLSLPDLRGPVPRHDWVEVSYLDREGEKQQRRLEGFEARVVQHEIDHLDGTLFIDRMRRSEDLAFRREYQRYHATSTEPDE
jgi:peptide deformylase